MSTVHSRMGLIVPMTRNAAPHLPPPGRQVERRKDIRTRAKPPSGKRGRRLGAGALLGMLVKSIAVSVAGSE